MHITHVDNLQSIIEADRLWSDAERIRQGLLSTNVGYSHIKERRLRHAVTVAAGGALGDYVPFNFCPRSVMLYVIHRGHTDYGGGQDAVIHLVSSVEAVVASGRPWPFTDRHADLGYAEQFDQIEDLARVDMGKGIALQFKRAYPENYEAYRRACKAGEVQPGRMFVFEPPGLANPRFIINFPTKRHWKARSRRADIEAGLKALVAEVGQRRIRSVAVPPLGCGHGGLDWQEVLPRMRAALADAPQVHWLVYEPTGTPAPEAMTDRTRRPAMTQGRAAVIGLIKRYLVPGFDYPVPILEVQKLVYFLQTAGEELKGVEFARGHYGPYADVLRHVLSRLEGHYISGFGDGRNKPETPIRLLPGAGEEAIAFLAAHPDTRERFERVADLIEGFESPYGMELLATVHWVAAREGATSPATALHAIQGWNLRKAKLMREAHVAAALIRLRERGWVEPAGGHTGRGVSTRPGEP